MMAYYQRVRRLPGGAQSCPERLVCDQVAHLLFVDKSIIFYVRHLDNSRHTDYNGYGRNDEHIYA